MWCARHTKDLLQSHSRMVKRKAIKVQKRICRAKGVSVSVSGSASASASVAAALEKTMEQARGSNHIKHRMSKPPLLPREIITDILLRLPAVKSLIRFTCVSKSWRSLISDPVFMKMHLSRSSFQNSNSILILHGPPKNAPYSVSIRCAETFDVSSTVTLPIHEPFVTVVGTCNGLLCLSTTPLTLDQHTSHQVYLYNPATRELKTLPLSNFNRIPSAECKVNFCKFGFGFDPSTDDYKVIKILTFSNGKTDVEVYRLSTDSWKRTGDIFPSRVRFLSFCKQIQVVLNGYVHWIVPYMLDSDLELYKSNILTFDLSKEVFELMMIPDCARNIRGQYLGLLWGCLSILGFNSRDHNHIEIWILKEYGSESWMKHSVIKICDGNRVAWGFGNTGKILLERGRPGRLDWYDMKSETESDLGSSPSDISEFVSGHVESLVSVMATNKLKENRKPW